LNDSDKENQTASAISSTKNPTCTGLELDPGLGGGRSATDSLSRVCCGLAAWVISWLLICLSEWMGASYLDVWVDGLVVLITLYLRDLKSSQQYV
jgi:hypothetical protein